MTKNKKLFSFILFIIFIFIFSFNCFATILYSEPTDLINECKSNYNYFFEFITYDSEDSTHYDYTYVFSDLPCYIVYDEINGYFARCDEPTRVHIISSRYNRTEWVDGGSYDSSIIQMTITDDILSSNYNLLFDDNSIFFQQRSRTTNGSSSGNANNESNNSNESSGILDSIGNWFNSVISGITQGFNNVIQNITSLLDKLNPLSDNFFLNGVINFLSTILSYINPFSENFFGYKLVDLIRTILTTIFVPDSDAILSLVNNTKNKFSFIDDIKSQITTFKSFLNNINSSQTYSFTMNNKYFNGTVYIIDLSWFASLKPWTDAIITGFVYLKFLWSLFIKAPGIIAGQPMNYDFEGMRDDISVGGRLKSSSRRT